MENNARCFEIVNLDQLKAVKREGKGYIVIKDIIRNTIHRPECDHVNLIHFRKKVLDNEKKNGGYFWIDSIENARDKFNAKFCMDCE